MMLPPDPMGPAALTALKQTAGDLSMYESMKNGIEEGSCHTARLKCCECVVREAGWRSEDLVKKKKKKNLGLALMPR